MKRRVKHHPDDAPNEVSDAEIDALWNRFFGDCREPARPKLSDNPILKTREERVATKEAEEDRKRRKSRLADTTPKDSPIERAQEEIVRRYNAGEPAADIAAATGFKIETMYSALRRWEERGVYIRRRLGEAAQKWNPHKHHGKIQRKKAQIIARYNAGEKVTDIAASLGFNAHSVRRTISHWARLGEVELRNPRQASSGDDAAVT